MKPSDYASSPALKVTYRPHRDPDDTQGISAPRADDVTIGGFTLVDATCICDAVEVMAVTIQSVEATTAC